MYVISLGGSVIINQDGINTPYYSDLVKLISDSEGKYTFVVGGGNLARTYIEAGRKLGITQPDSLDRLGVYATHINALLFHYALLNAGIRSYHIRNIDEEPDILLESNETIVTAGGPLGQTTDMIAIRCCQRFGSSFMINVTSVGRIYDRDPTEDVAKYLSRVYASDLIEMWGTEHDPGLNRPFEPKAVNEALNLGITVHVIGSDIQDLKDALEGRKHSGTIIIPK